MKKKINKWLKRKNLSVREFAEALHINQGTVYAWIHDGHEPRDMAKTLIGQKFPDCPLINPLAKELPDQSAPSSKR